MGRMWVLVGAAEGVATIDIINGFGIITWSEQYRTGKLTTVNSGVTSCPILKTKPFGPLALE